MNNTVKIRKNRSGYYCVIVPTPNGRSRWVSTGERNRIMAKAVLEESGVDRLVHLANADCLTANAISAVTSGRRFMCDDILKAWREAELLSSVVSTVASYESWITLFLDMFHCHQLPLTWVRLMHLSEFVNEPGLKLTTKKMRLCAMKSFFNFACANAYVLANLPQAVRIDRREMTVVQLQRRQRFPLTIDEVDKLVAYFHDKPFWKFAVIIGYWTGLRLIDIASLERQSISDTEIRVYTKKRNRWVTLPITDPLIGSPQLLATLQEMKEMPKAHKTYFFPLERDIVLSSLHANLSVYFGRYLQRCGISGKSFHCLRYAFCHRLLAAGYTISEIANLTGHADLETTARYAGTKLEPIPYHLQQYDLKQMR